MTVKLSITSIDKVKNEQRRYAKYLQWGDSFGVALQKVQEGAGEISSGQPEYICIVSNKDGNVMIQDETRNGLFVNGKEIGQTKLQDGDVVWLTKSGSAQLFFHIYELTGKDLFKGSRSSKDPIIIPVAKIEAAPVAKTEDYSNPVGHEINGYYFEDVLSYGNMGIVYKGVQKSLKRPVAIKAVSPKHLNNPTLIKRFMNMANLAWRLNHPYIVQIYDTGISQEFKIHYVVMEYVEGETLRDLLNRRKKLEIELACKMMSQLASALSFAHRQNIVHRDVNPSNIVITKNDYIKLVGLALSKVLDPQEEQLNLTVKGQAMGTVGYISPEQAKSAADVDFRTDIYSLGVIFYECVCGRLPYDAEVLKDPAKYMKALRNKPEHPPHKLNPQVPETLSKIIMKCLEPSLEKRYQKAEDVLDDIKMSTEEAQLSAAQKRIRAMFPKTPNIPGFDFHVTFEPMESIGGDFYDFIPLDNHRWGISIGDVTGHGVEAAVIMGMVKAVVKLMAKNLDSASEVLEYANKEISPDMDSTTFTTVGYSILNTQNKTFAYARAGHNPLILYNAERHPTLMTYSPKGALVGMPLALNCETANIKLQSGDVLVQYTDGITEAKSKSGEEFGMDRLCEVIEQYAGKGVLELANVIKKTITEFSKGNRDADDITMIIIHVK
jgi:serine/threonine protein kinase